MQIKKQQLELDMEKWTGSKLGKQYIKAYLKSPCSLKSRDVTLPTKVCIVKTMVFPLVMYGCEGWTIKKAECQRTDAFELMLKLNLQYFGHLMGKADS